jgi:hypothetical protein
VTGVRIDRNQRVRAAIDAGVNVARGAHAIDHSGHLEVVVIDGGVDEDRAGRSERESLGKSKGMGARSLPYRSAMRGGTGVLIGGVCAPLYFVSPNQINSSCPLVSPMAR